MKYCSLYILLLIFISSTSNAQNTDYKLFSRQYKSPATAVNISPDGNWILAGFEDGSLRILDHSDLTEIKTFESVAPTAIYDIEMSPKMDVIFLASGNRIMLFDTSGVHINNWAHHKNTMWSMAIDPEGKYMVSTEVNKTFQLINIFEGEIEQSMRAHSDITLAVDFSPDGTKIASGSSDQTVLLWDVESREVVQKLQGISDNIYDVEFSPDGSLLAAASRDSRVRIWDLEKNEMLYLLDGHQDMVFEVAFSPDGKYLLSASADQGIKLWDLESGTVLYAFLENAGSIPDICFLPDSKRFVSACTDGTLSLREVHPEIFVLKYFGKEYEEALKQDPLFLPRQKGEKKAAYEERMQKASEKRKKLIDTYYQKYLNGEYSPS